jgi:hypothetical protein
MTKRSAQRQRKQRPYPTKKPREEQQQAPSPGFDDTLAMSALMVAKAVSGGIHATYARADELAMRLTIHSALTAGELAQDAFLSCAPPDWMELSDTTLDTLCESAYIPAMEALTGQKVPIKRADAPPDLPPALQRMMGRYR